MLKSDLLSPTATNIIAQRESLGKCDTYSVAEGDEQNACSSPSATLEIILPTYGFGEAPAP